MSVVGFNFDFDYYLENYGVEPSNSEYTVKTYTLGAFGSVPDNGQIDFQVKAQVGYSYAVFGNHVHIMPIGINFKVVEESDWSNTQTFSVAESAVIPEFPSWTILPLVLMGTAVVAVYKKKLTKQSTY